MAQRAYRDRKEQRLRELEAELTRCKEEHERLLHSYQTQKITIDALQARTRDLASYFASLARKAATASPREVVEVSLPVSG